VIITPHCTRTNRRGRATQYCNVVRFGIHSLGSVCVSQGRGRETEWGRHGTSGSCRTWVVEVTVRSCV